VPKIKQAREYCLFAGELPASLPRKRRESYCWNQGA